MLGGEPRFLPAVKHLPEDHPARQGMRLVIFGIFVNGGLALVKAVAGVVGNTYALVADAIESLSDVITSVIVWWGLCIAAQPPDDDHPYGHGKAEPLATVVVAVALFGAGIAIAYQSVREILVPHKMPAPFTLVVLVVVVVVKEALFRRVLRAGQEADSTAVQGDAWHHRSDAITSAAAFVGIAVAILGDRYIGGPNWSSADDWAALLAAGLIGFNAWNLLRPALAELTDATPDQAIIDEVRRIARTVPGVVDLHHTNVRKMGFEYYVDLDVIVDRDIAVWQGHDIAHLVQDAIRKANPRIPRVLVHVEPSRLPSPPAPPLPPDKEE
jgi:cation diffusion facilitator family transporter